MKTIYSMQEFYDRVLNLAKTKNQTYVSVECAIESNNKVKFRCFINPYSWHTADTPEDAIQKLRNQMYGKEIKDIDVKVEVEHEHANQ